jgi:pimeloyl-ACP methyl ester carboxylesterase
MKKTIYFLLLFFWATSLHASEGVILLHGLSRSSSSMEEMESKLKDAGFIVLNVDYPSRTATIEALSDAAIGTALQNPSLKNCSKIHFVTHSLGGILVRSYFKRHESSRLGRVVMLGPPNQGSEVVDTIGSWWLFRKLNGPAGNELGTDNESTPNMLGAVDFELGIIAGDRSINWINSMILPDSDDGKISVERTRVTGMKEHIVVHATHPYLMKNDEVIEETIRFLKTGSFNPDTSHHANGERETRPKLHH